MNDILSKALTCIEREADEFDLSFELVEGVISDYGEENIASRLYEDIDSSIQWGTVASLYAILVWSTSDNGNGLLQSIEQWIIECEDERKIQIALNLDVYPFREFEDMNYNLTKVKKKFPNLKNTCNLLIESRSEVGE